MKRKTFVDEDWKETNNKVFKKKKCFVGYEYQVSNLPIAGSYRNENNPKSLSYCELIWDPIAAKSNGISLDAETDIISKLPYNIKEQALLELAKQGYDVKKLEEKVHHLQPMDGSNWSKTLKEKYSMEIFRLRKDFKALSSSLKVPLKTCLSYYLGTFKSSNYYRIVKAVCIQDRITKAESTEHTIDSCAVCGLGGSLLICDECDGEYHMTCLNPPLAKVPDGRWECDDCIDKKIISSQEDFIRNSILYEKDCRKKSPPQSVTDNRTSSTDNDLVMYRPIPSFVERVRQFVQDVNNYSKK